MLHRTSVRRAGLTLALAAAAIAAAACSSASSSSTPAAAGATERTHAASAAATERGATWLPRSKDKIAGVFNGRDLIEPGLVLVSHWRPDAEPGPDASQAWTYCGVAPV